MHFLFEIADTYLHLIYKGLKAWGEKKYILPETTHYGNSAPYTGYCAHVETVKTKFVNLKIF